MNKRLYELKKETNYCAGVGEIACLLEHVGKPLCWLMDRDFATCK